MKELLTTIAVYPIGAAYIAGLALAFSSDNPWLYHPLFIFFLFVPAVLALTFSITGRNSGEVDRAGNASNLIGTMGLVIIGLFMLVVYGWALWCKP